MTDYPHRPIWFCSWRAWALIVAATWLALTLWGMG
jgi:hypothetical protein